MSSKVGAWLSSSPSPSSPLRECCRWWRAKRDTNPGAVPGEAAGDQRRLPGESLTIDFKPSHLQGGIGFRHLFPKTSRHPLGLERLEADELEAFLGCSCVKMHKPFSGMHSMM